MAIGESIFRLATGIIQNERQRKQLEFQEQKFQDQQQQAERTFRLKEQEVQARQGFLQVQQEQQELAAAKAAGQSEINDINLQIKQTQLDLEKAKLENERRGPSQARKLNVSLITKEQELNQAAKAVRNRALISSIPDDDPNKAALTTGFQLTNAATSADVEKHIDGLNSQLRLLSRSPGAALNPSILTSKQEEIQQLRTYQRALLSLEQTPLSNQEIAEGAAEANLSVETALAISSNAVLPNVAAREAFGANAPLGTLDLAVQGVQEGDFSFLNAYVDQFPENLKNENGRFTREGALQLRAVLLSRGVPDDQIIKYFEASKGNQSR